MTQSTLTDNTSQVLDKPELPEKLNNSITEQFLKSNNDRIPVTIKDYAGQAEGDRITLYSGGPAASPVANATVTRSSGNTIIVLDAIAFRRLSPGTHAMYYTVTPKSDVTGPNSMFLLYRWLLD